MSFWDWIAAISQLRALFDQLNDKAGNHIGDSVNLPAPLRANALVIKARGGQRWRVTSVYLVKEK